MYLAATTAGGLPDFGEWNEMKRLVEERMLATKAVADRSTRAMYKRLCIKTVRRVSEVLTIRLQEQLSEESNNANLQFAVNYLAALPGHWDALSSQGRRDIRSFWFPSSITGTGEEEAPTFRRYSGGYVVEPASFPHQMLRARR